ncbi:MAG: FAD-dependent oxidoreductase [Acidobacteria bacterium]|nr:FAD-dependent oxidoreductase [Acidobacteriota bacterium]
MAANILIFGAGPAGLSAAYHLGRACEVFEKEAYPGGHCHTHLVDGFGFDEGAHVFFGRDECSETFVKRPLAGELLAHTAEIWNNYGGTRTGRYPVQVNAHALPADLATRCVLDLIDVAGQPDTDVRSYEDWCHASFGKTFANEFMLRYARKVWTVDPAELNTEWVGSAVGNRVSRPSLEQVIRGAIDAEPQELNYLTRFSYPKSGGFGRIIAPLAGAVPGVRLGCGVVQIESVPRRVTFTDGTVRTYDAAISTIPLPTLIAQTVDAPADVRAAARRLMWTSLRSVNLGVARRDVGPGHWVYFYDHDIPFFRVSFPSKFSPANAPEGHTAVSCEIAYSRRRPLDERNLVGRVIDGLCATGVLRDSDRIVLEHQVDVPYAYVVYDFARAENLALIHAWMERTGLYPCGRFGEWGYHWSFESMESGRRVAAKVTERLGLGAGANR